MTKILALVGLLIVGMVEIAAAETFRVVVDLSVFHLNEMKIINSTETENDWVLEIVDLETNKVIGTQKTNSYVPTMHLDRVFVTSKPFANIKVRLIEKDLIFNDAYDIADLSADTAHSLSVFSLIHLNNQVIAREVVSNNNRNQIIVTQKGSARDDTTTQVLNIIENTMIEKIVTQVVANSAFSARIEALSPRPGIVETPSRLPSAKKR